MEDFRNFKLYINGKSVPMFDYGISGRVVAEDRLDVSAKNPKLRVYNPFSVESIEDFDA